MKTPTTFKVYNAAAGSGKTYTLVKEYLILLFTSKYIDSYRNILAVTFTNKAVAEMKTRIVEYLHAFGLKETLPKYIPMLEDLASTTGLEQEVLKKKSVKILKSIIHNYAAFDVMTIDTFTHRVIRTFANDLEIPLNFEVEMDTDTLLEETIDRLLAKVGQDPRLTKIIVAFALSKLDDDKSWDIARELHLVAKMLLDENERKHLDKIKHKTEADFDVFKTIVKEKLQKSKEIIDSIAQTILHTITQNGLVKNDFSRGTIPGYFENIINKKLTVKSFEAKWVQDIENTNFYTSTLAIGKKETIDQIRQKIEAAVQESKKIFFEIQLLENIQKNSTPLSILNAIHKEMEILKKERNILLISEFNNVISTAIKGQPAPFIYERLGERYHDYFIDEFQDTSQLQWENIIPLADNALTSEIVPGKQGSMTIVGDAKQAIYRWRGGKAEQFMGLSLSQNPFSTQDKKVYDLPRNYRSFSEVIAFNNDFFTHLAQGFSSEVHQQLYLQGNQQESNSKKGGFVKLSFVEATNVAEEDEIYPIEIHAAITELQQKGYDLQDICILTRKQHQGVVIANYLASKNIPIISSDTLLIANAPEVLCIVHILSLYLRPNNKIAKVALLNFLATRFSVSDQHGFIEKGLTLQFWELQEELAIYGVIFNFDRLHVLPLYESVEYIIRSFHLNTEISAYLQFFLDVVFDFGQKKGPEISGFLTHWELKKDKLSIVAPIGKAAVQIMTVHKSKGLEFPVVLFPYANEDLYRDRDAKTWYPIDAKDFAGFEEGFVNYSMAIAQYGEEGGQLVAKRQSEQELDAINLLYVAMTRAIEQLYVFTKKELNTKGAPNPRKYSGKFIHYLQDIMQWDPNCLKYCFGQPDKPKQTAHKEEKKVHSKTVKHLFSTPKETHHVHIVTNADKIWDAGQQESKEKGILIHELMSQVFVANDILSILENAILQGIINASQKEQLFSDLSAIVNHPELEPYYKRNLKILNERDIMVKGALYRPDRLVIEANNVSIIDYKTGIYSKNHPAQVLQYAALLDAMGYTVVKRILVYIYPSIEVRMV